jgi:hypothetical protein
VTLDDVLPPAVRKPATSDADDETLGNLATHASEALQRIQDIARRDAVDAARIRFPRGYLREALLWRNALSFLSTISLRKNVAYTLMLHDVQSWVLKRTDLEGQAREMLVKGAITSLGSVAEAILVDVTSPPLGRRQKVASRVKHLHDQGVVDDSLQDDLRWLWDTRNRQHLYELAAPEFDLYTREDHPRAESTLTRLIQVLQAHSVAPAA